MRTSPTVLPIAACFALFAAKGFSAAEDDAAATIERLHKGLVEMAALEPDPELGERYAFIEPVVRETHDLAGMGQFTVRRGWRSMTETDRATFLDAFERLSVTTYASRFASIGADNFAVLGSEATDDRSVRVDAVIRRDDGDDVPMEYLLELQDESWRIVHIRADGVSELTLMRSEYSAVLAEQGFDALLATIESEIRSL